MSSASEQFIKKKVHHEGVIQKRSNHVLYEDVDATEKILIKTHKKPEQKSKSKPGPREILDNYRYIETKEIRSKDERRASIVRHQRLGKPIGKETPYERTSFKEYKTNTTYVQKRSKFGSYDDQKTYKQDQSKYSEKTFIQKKNYGEKNNKSGQYNNSQRSNRAEQYSSNTTKVKKLAQKTATERKNDFSNRNANNRQNVNERKRETNQTKKAMKERRQDMNKKEQKINKGEENVNEEKQKEQKEEPNVNVNEQEQILNEGEQNMNESQKLHAGDNQDNFQQKDSYDYRELNLEQNRINERASNQGQVLPFYPPGQENKYQSKTEKLVFCGTCGKPKKPKQNQKIENYNQMRNSITREIIGEKSPQGDYVIRYSQREVNNQPSSSQFELQGQGNEIQQRLEEKSASKTHYCPVHGYIIEKI